MYFEKWQALGNHFVLVFDPVNELALERAAARLCDRYTGVGADGEPHNTLLYHLR